MYAKIMIAIDGSDVSGNALQEGCHVARSYGANLCLVHVIGDGDEAAEQIGHDVLSRAKSIAPNQLSVETRLLRADAEYGLNGVAEAIAEAVKDWKADLLVVGTSNRRGLERLVIGSVAEQVIAKVESSMLLVRPR
jgi:nucleotide-binding universal stress UspA family protein